MANTSNKRQNRSKYSIFSFLDVDKANSCEEIKGGGDQETSGEKMEQLEDAKEDNKKSSLILPKPVSIYS